MKVSFVIPTYNYANFLERCLLSVLQQDYHNYEVIIVDDGSTDGTSDVVSRIQWKYHSKAISYLYQDNAGPSVARNNGAAKAKGKYIWCLDADDTLIDGAIGRMVKATETHPKAWLLFSGYRSVNEDGKQANHEPTPLGEDQTENFRRYILKKIKGLTPGSALVREKAFETIGFPAGVHNNEDVVFYSHLFACYPAVSIPGIVLVTHRHKGSLRYNMLRIEETGLTSVDRLFDKDLLTPKQMSFRKLYLTRRYLSIFRSYYRNGDFEKARRYYKKAIQESPRFILNWSYLRKYLRSIGKK
jgi:pentatricopeptide repeat protein